MGKWIAFDLRIPARPNDSGWENVLRLISGKEMLDLQMRIEAWVKTNKTHSVKSCVVYGEDSVRRGKKPDQGFPTSETSAYIRVKFRSARDAVIFKLYFSEYIFTPVHNPKIRATIETLLSNTLAEEIRREIDKELIANVQRVQKAMFIPSEFLKPVEIATVQRV